MIFPKGEQAGRQGPKANAGPQRETMMLHSLILQVPDIFPYPNPIPAHRARPVQLLSSRRIWPLQAGLPAIGIRAPPDPEKQDSQGEAWRVDSQIPMAKTTFLQWRCGSSSQAALNQHSTNVPRNRTSYEVVPELIEMNPGGAVTFSCFTTT